MSGNTGVRVSYFVTSIGYVVEVLRQDHLIDHHREMDVTADRDAMKSYARLHASEFASRYGVEPDSIAYDHEGEACENALFG